MHPSRQGEMKCRATLRISSGPQAATVCFNDGPANRQAHTRALRLSRIESIKNLI
jgi:hypothetical protein